MDEMIGEFVTETTEGLALLDQELVKLEQSPQDKNTLSTIFRVMHTIKGTCGFLGLHRLEKIAHAGEDILGKFRDGKLQVTPQAITLILQSVDRIKEIVECLTNTGQEPEGDDSTLIGTLNLFAEGGSIAADTPQPEESDDFSSFFKGDDALEELMHKEEAAEKERKATAEKIARNTTKPSAIQHTKKAIAAMPIEQKEKETGAVTGNQTIRVNIDVLEKMMQMVGELVLSRNQLLQIARSAANQQFVSPLQQLSHITTELQENVMKTRMQPIGSAWSKFPRLVRDLSHELSKRIELEMIGEETELDRQLLEAIKDPLTHMVRNSCDHGIETPDVRKANGKPDHGTVTLNAYHEGGHIVIDISDDGKGLNVERIKEKAISNGLTTAAELTAMSEKQILQFIFQPGFSTAERVTEVSGRGVGMDVVRTNIEKIGGAIDLSSIPGEGSKVSIKIPLTLAIVSVLIVEKAHERFAIPQINVREVLQVGDQHPTRLEKINNALVIRLRETLLPVLSLSDILRLPDKKCNEQQETSTFVVVCNSNGRDFGIIVDHVHNIEEIVVKPVSEMIKSVPIFSGNTILGDGSVIMILDPGRLADAVGEIKLSGHKQEELDEMQDAAGLSDRMTSFLLFLYSSNTPNAVPLELVWRLEEIDAKQIEYASGLPVVQYRGEIMRLIMLDDSFALPETGTVKVIVFSYDGAIIGLPVKRIVDIVQSSFDLKIASGTKGYLGSTVISGHTTDVIDVGHLVNRISTTGNSEHSGKSATGNILLVDDSHFSVQMLTTFLTSSGYKVKAVESGIEALATLEQAQGKFDMIITDIQMPGMDGFRLTQACHAFPHSASIPVIGCAQTLDQETLLKSQQAGMVTCIPKNNRPLLLEAMARTQMKPSETA